MSLNRAEQRVFDYLQGHRDERQFWEAKVRGAAAGSEDIHAVANRLDGELWRYHVERSAVVEPFRSAARSEGTARTSMKNLAELLIRLWTEPRPKKKTAEAGRERF
jgi:hypothetical protein